MTRQTKHNRVNRARYNKNIRVNSWGAIDWRGRAGAVVCVVFALVFGMAGTILLSIGRAIRSDQYLFDFRTPIVIDSQYDQPMELGVRFQSLKAGYVRGVRFYKSSNNVGPHSGTLWTNTGIKLASGNFSQETVSGWQRLYFTEPVKISPNTTYVVSYHTQSGHYSTEPNFFKALYTNGPLSAPASMPQHSNGLYAYGASTFPSQGFSATNYWVDPIFNTQISRPPLNLFDYQAPAQLNAPNTKPIELGTKFTTAKAGLATGVQFYRSSEDYGPHTGSLWSAGGTKLASITFKNEVEGWNTAEFTRPIKLKPNTTYVVSYYSPTGHYASSENFFAGPYERGPLRVPVSGGVMVYSRKSAYPEHTTITNYWVDILFVPTTKP